MQLTNLEVIQKDELEKVEGGSGIIEGLVVGILVDGLVKATTGKSCADWVADGLDYAGQKAIDTWRWLEVH